MEECKICGKICKDLRGLFIHLKLTKNSHYILAQEYYDIYLRKSICEDICKNCGNEYTQFQNLSKGYREYCKDCSWTMKYNKIRESNTGKKRSNEFRQRQSESMKGEKNHRFGKLMSEEAKKNLSDSIKGENSCHYGKSPSEDTRKLQSESAKKRGISKEQRKKMTNARIGILIPIEVRLKASITKQYTLKDYQEKYPLLCLVEELRDNPKPKIGKAGIQAKCKKCTEWFTPTYSQISARAIALETGIGECYFYCSDECKDSCSLFNVKISTVLNHNIKNTNVYQSEYQTFRKEVLTRQLQTEDICFNHCEICNSEINLHVHHEHPQKTHSIMSLDPDNGIVLCGSCHYKFGHTNECNTSNLANIERCE